MNDKKSTNKNFLVISGTGEGSLVWACSAFELNPEGMSLTYQITRGLIQIGPEGTDPKRCIILSNGRKDNPAAWSLIDYRTSVSDADLEAKMKELRNKLEPRVRDAVLIESTQDLYFRDNALR